MNTKIVKLKDFFDFNTKQPINRLAYTKEDMDYKIKIIRKMQELGLEITMDAIGNICGSISIGNNPTKTLAIGSHTDSVYNGGQYDGPVGVIVGLQTVEQLLKNKNCNGILKIVIYACEESSRFGNSCLGSKYLNGTIVEKDFDEILDQNALKSGKKITLKQAIQESSTYLKEQVNEIQEVRKIFEKVDYSLETHIEQYELLKEQYKKNGKQDTIGIVNSVGSAVRIAYDVQGESGHTGSTPMKKRKNAVDATSYIGIKIRKLGKTYEKCNLGRASQVEITTPGHNGSFNQLSNKAKGLIDFRLLGTNTPEQVLTDFEKIVKKAEEKTRTKITTTIVSKGTPIITDSELNTDIAKICNKRNINYLEMPSYAGQDTGYVPARQKTMLFIPSTGGSHNPDEDTKKKFIKPATNVLTDLSQLLLQEKFKDRQTVQLDEQSHQSNKEIMLKKELKKEAITK